MANEKLNKGISKLENLTEKAKASKDIKKEETLKLFHVFINNEEESEEKLSDKVKRCIAKLKSKFE